MAKYNIREAYQVWLERTEPMEADIERIEQIDLTLIDMLGFHLWRLLKEEERTPESKQKVIFASLLAAYLAGESAAKGELEVVEEFFDFVETLDIPNPDTVERLESLLNWD